MLPLLSEAMVAGPVPDQTMTEFLDMGIRITLPEIDDLEDDCLSVPGPIAFDRGMHQEVWIAPSDAELERRRYPVGDDIERAKSVGRFGDADGLFLNAPPGEAGVFHPCPWGKGIPDDGDIDDNERRIADFAGALALLLREYAPGVGAVASFVVFNMPSEYGFVTYGAIPDPGARAAALCAAYVAANKLPPSTLAVEALQNGPLPDETPEVVKAAVRKSVEVLADRVGTALANSGVQERTLPRP